MLEAEGLLNSFIIHGDLVEEEASKRFSLAVGRKRTGSCALVGLWGTLIAHRKRNVFWKTILHFIWLCCSFCEDRKDCSTAHLPRCLQACACCYAEVGSISMAYLDYSCMPSWTLSPQCSPLPEACCCFHFRELLSGLAIIRTSSFKLPKSSTMLSEQQVLLAGLDMLPVIQLHMMVYYMTK